MVADFKTIASSVIGICLWVCGTSPAAAVLDLRTAVVVAPADLNGPERKAVQMLLDEIEARTQIRLAQSETWPAGASPAIVLGPVRVLRSIATARNASMPAATAKAEGYQIWSRVEGPSPEIWISGNDSRGLVFGVGRMLRTMRLSRQRIEFPADVHIDSAPRASLRGHQLGYRPKCNSYDGWTVTMWEQYIRDLAVFGTNAIELIPPRSDDLPDSPHFTLPPMQMMTRMSGLADAHGLDVWIWYPAMDKDYSDPKTVERAISEWGEVFAKLPRVDAVFVPGGDPGHTRPKVLFALLEKQTANLHRYHPKAQMWVSPQSFNQPWLEEFFDLLRKEPAWLSGIVYGPQVRIPLAECRRLTPAKYPIRHYPDITHAQHCQYPVPDWDIAYAVTEGREPICPRPTQMANLYRVTAPQTIGFLTYSEGCNDDVNKIVLSALGWDENADIGEVLREYSRYFIDPEHENDFAQGLLALEQNWIGPVLSNDGIDTTLRTFQAMEKSAPPRLKLNWRFQQALYRAYYDAYVRTRLSYETDLEKGAMAELRESPKRGSSVAMERADLVLNKAMTEPVARDLRARVFELAEALFQSIRMQLSVERYAAESVGRGANLDRIDVPLNNRLFLHKQFEQIRKLDNESERLKRIDALVSWTDPGPGGFYDDLGNLTRQPHLVRGVGWEQDPAFYQTAMVRVEDVLDGGSSQPISWWTTAGSLYDAPLRMHYDGLDPQGHYLLRVVYAPGEDGSLVRCVAGERYEVHPPLRREAERLEFAIPPQATASGKLDLAWYPQPGRGHAGRNLQVAEVWIVKR